MKYKFTRIIEKYGWDEAAKESRKFTIEDVYDPLDWDDVVNVIGYTVQGHNGQTIKFCIKEVNEEEE